MVVPNKPTTNSEFCDRQNHLGASIGILTFEFAAAMSRLVSLHRSLSEPELRRLRADTMRSPGVSHLTSTDQHFLFRLACAELISHLDTAAAAVSRFSARCDPESLLAFPRTYANLKTSSATTHIPTLSVKGVERRVKQMEKFIAVAVKLLEELNSKKKKRVEKLKQKCLWYKTFDEVVEIMSQAVFAIFARICAVFSPFVPGLPPILVSGGGMRFNFFNTKLRVFPIFTGRQYASGPIDRRKGDDAEEMAIRNSCPIIGREGGYKLPRDCKKVLLPEQRTVGGSGLAIQFANIIVLAERLMRIKSGGEEPEEPVTRDGIYVMLPANLKGMVRRRLRVWWREIGEADGELSEWWREAVKGILRWLGPVARDTLKWQEERSMDNRQRLNTEPRIFALQTLMFSDREKVEMAIVEVLVGLSCICWYDSEDGGGRWN